MKFWIESWDLCLVTVRQWFPLRDPSSQSETSICGDPPTLSLSLCQSVFLVPSLSRLSVLVYPSLISSSDVFLDVPRGLIAGVLFCDPSVSVCDVCWRLLSPECVLQTFRRRLSKVGLCLPWCSSALQEMREVPPVFAHEYVMMMMMMITVLCSRRGSLWTSNISLTCM